MYTAPQEVTQLMVDVINDSSIEVQWGPPARSNGILTHYTIDVFSLVSEFNFSSIVDASSVTEITISGLSTLFISKILVHES